MISLCFIFVSTFVTWVFTAYVLAFCARIFGSPRGRARVGLAVAFFLVVMGIIFLALDLAVAGPSVLASFVKTAMMVVWIWVIFALFKFAFQLSAGRIWALFGVYLALILIQFIFAVSIIKPFVCEAFFIPTASMSPTIEPGDRFVVEKLLHPRRWDIVAYRHAEDDGRTSVYCKRLIGLPGERLRFEDGEIFVNDQAVSAPAVVAGRYHASPYQYPSPSARYQEGETIVLGSQQYFIVGDNVNVSKDSRIYGPVNGSALVGVVDLKYWPLNRIRIYR
jgi:signal peptidase I